jgi:hypothetical protein
MRSVQWQWQSSPRCDTTNSLYGEIKILVVSDECNAAQELQINATNYVERTDLVLLGEESWSGADRLTPRGLPSIIAGRNCPWGMPIATCSSASTITNFKNFWDNYEREVWARWKFLICASRLYRHTAGITLEFVGWTESSQITGTLVHGVVFEPLRADAYSILVNSGQVETILNPPRWLVKVTAQLPGDVDLPHVPHGNAHIYTYPG